MSEEPVVGDAPPRSNVLFSNKVYNVLLWVAMVFLPAFGSFYLGLGAIWEDLPEPDKVVATVVLLDTTLGLLLGVSKKQYERDPHRFAGRIVYGGVDPDTGEPSVAMIPKDDPKAWEGQKEVTFNIVNRR